MHQKRGYMLFFIKLKRKLELIIYKDHFHRLTILIMDNAKIHKINKVIKLVKIWV